MHLTRQVPTDSLLSSVQLPEGKRMQAGPPGPTPRALLPEPVGRTVWGVTGVSGGERLYKYKQS